MKKILVILVMLVYGVSTSGMTINLHYCCGKLDDVSFTTKHSNGCEKTEGIKKSSCCSDKQFSARLNLDQQSAAKWVPSVKSAIVEPAYVDYVSNFPQHIIFFETLPRGTPITRGVPIFIANCTFKI